ncbi:MAG TPA: hypothetical protein VGO46_06775 [Gemmatimonadaceae bacterium]|jgi:hypothetical protein|nr:hypothetical protein [Gemmatimonadaceae bacterium]
MLSRFWGEIKHALGAKEASRTVRRAVGGIDVVLENTRPDISDEDVFARLAEVLAMIERYAPAKLRRLRKDIAGIDVKRFACRGAFFGETRRVMCELTFVVNRDFSIAEIASSLLHEGIHARVHAAGVFRTPASLAKEERLCRTTELWWGRTVPNGEKVIERALASLELGDRDVAPAVDWREAARRVAEVDRAARGI